MVFAAHDWQCNLFVCDVTREAGAAGRIPARPSWPCPTAGEWANPNARIPNWRPLKPGEKRQPGDVMAYQYPYSDATGHSAVMGNNGPVSSHDLTPVDNNFPNPHNTPVTSNSGTRGNSLIRRWPCSHSPRFSR